MQAKYSPNAVSMQFKCSSHSAQMQFNCSISKWISFRVSLFAKQLAGLLLEIYLIDSLMFDTGLPVDRLVAAFRDFNEVARSVSLGK